MKTFYHLAIIFLVVIFQVIFVPWISFYQSLPNFVLITLISLVFLGKSDLASYWAGAGGILLDLFSGQRFGAFTLSFLLTLFILQIISKKLIFPSFSSFIPLFFFFSLFQASFFALLTSFYSWSIFTSSLYNLPFGILVYYFLGKKRKREELIKI